MERQWSIEMAAVTSADCAPFLRLLLLSEADRFPLRTPGGQYFIRLGTGAGGVHRFTLDHRFVTGQFQGQSFGQYI